LPILLDVHSVNAVFVYNFRDKWFYVIEIERGIEWRSFITWFLGTVSPLSHFKQIIAQQFFFPEKNIQWFFLSDRL